MKKTILMFVVAVMLCGCEFDMFPEYVPAVIKYEIVGDSSDVDVTIINPSIIEFEEYESVSCPWSIEIRDEQPGFCEMYAHSNTAGTITVRIYDDGELVESYSCTASTAYGCGAYVHYMAPDGEH